MIPLVFLLCDLFDPEILLRVVVYASVVLWTNVYIKPVPLGCLSVLAFIDVVLVAELPRGIAGTRT